MERAILVYTTYPSIVEAEKAGRALVEPRAVRPPMAALEQLQGHGYQLLGQLSAIQSILLLRRQRLELPAVTGPLADTAQAIGQALELDQPWCARSSDAPHDPTLPERLSAIPEDLPDPFAPNTNAWLLRRLHLADDLAARVRADALRVIGPSAAP